MHEHDYPYTAKIWFRASLNTLGMKRGVFTFSVCAEQIEQLSLSAEHMLHNAKCAMPRQLWVLRTLTALQSGCVPHFVKGKQQIRHPALQLWGLKASSSDRSCGNSAQVVFIFTLIWRIHAPASRLPSLFPFLSIAGSRLVVQDTYLLIYPHLCCRVVKGSWAADNLGWMRMRSLSKWFVLNDILNDLLQGFWVQLYLEENCVSFCISPPNLLDFHFWNTNSDCFWKRRDFFSCTESPGKQKSEALKGP